MNATQTSCPGCGRVRFCGRFRLRQQSVVLNYRFVSKRAAEKVPKEDADLRQCTHCGLIFNSTFHVNVVPYNERYENRQCEPEITALLRANQLCAYLRQID